MEKLGIIGGMGPAATARLFSRVVDFTDAACDQDHLDVTVLNRPSVPDRTAYLLARPGAHPFAPMLQDMARTLEEMGCAVLAMPCNTAHAALGEIESVLSSARLIDMPYEAAAFACSLGCARVGLLATDGTVQTGIYQRTFEGSGVELLTPDNTEDQSAVMDIIYNGVKAGDLTHDASAFRAACGHLLARGAEVLILGCTELPIAFVDYGFDEVTIDPTQILAEAALRAVGMKVKER